MGLGEIPLIGVLIGRRKRGSYKETPTQQVTFNAPARNPDGSLVFGVDGKLYYIEIQQQLAKKAGSLEVETERRPETIPTHSKNEDMYYQAQRALEDSGAINPEDKFETIARVYFGDEFVDKGRHKHLAKNPMWNPFIDRSGLDPYDKTRHLKNADRILKLGDKATSLEYCWALYTKNNLKSS